VNLANVSPMLRALVEWRDDLAKAAEARGDEMFMGVPDAWFEEPHWFCTKGHVSRVYLRSESGSRCMACHEGTILGPRMTEADFAQVLGGLALKVAQEGSLS
jgi:hypothetical protein